MYFKHLQKPPFFGTSLPIRSCQMMSSLRQILKSAIFKICYRKRNSNVGKLDLASTYSYENGKSDLIFPSCSKLLYVAKYSSIRQALGRYIISKSCHMVFASLTAIQVSDSNCCDKTRHSSIQQQQQQISHNMTINVKANHTLLVYLVAKKRHKQDGN